MAVTAVATRLDRLHAGRSHPDGQT